ncbi:unnamed protein product [Adineta steineri]|uniref:Uncharacterized protein n=1 Tax=Adineta steineri TaxID=433720 RepID=A0A815WZS8_9BILA|nr:unnamed protein product [Adineta steineri]CAF1661249.1 unnamed protein product [Adineta steineri]
MRRFESTVNVNNTNGYKGLSIGHDQSDFRGNASGIRLIDSNLDNETTYYTDITRDYIVLASAHIKRFHVKFLPNEPTNGSQSLPPSVVQFRLPHIY